MPQTPPVSNRHRGITLIESLVVVSILAITLAHSVPSITAITSRSSIRSTQELLMLYINEARVEAKANRMTARICPSNDGEFCLNSSDWRQGWLSYLDNDNSKDYNADDGDILIALHQPATSLGITVTLIANPPLYISINRNGTVINGGHLRICDPRVSLKKIDTITFSNQGRVGKRKRKEPCE